MDNPYANTQHTHIDHDHNDYHTATTDTSTTLDDLYTGLPLPSDITSGELDQYLGPFLHTTDLVTDFDLSVAAYHAHTETTQSIGTPKTIEAALDDATWQPAAHKELQGFIDLEVFEPCDTNAIPPDAIQLHTFWLFSEKKPDNTPKARLITINREWVGHKNKQASSPVAEALSSFLMYTQYAHNKSMNMALHDVSTAFLHAPVSDTDFFYLKTPAGLRRYANEHQTPTQFNTTYVRLRKYAYGLNTSPLEFHKTLVSVLHQHLYDSSFDNCLHLTTTSDLFVTEHVDDLLAIGTPAQITQLETLLLSHFKLKISHEPDYYLGSDLTTINDTLFVSLSTYIEQMTDTFAPLVQNYVTIPTTRPAVFTPQHGELPQPNTTTATAYYQSFVHENPITSRVAIIPA